MCFYPVRQLRSGMTACHTGSALVPFIENTLWSQRLGALCFCVSACFCVLYILARHMAVIYSNKGSWWTSAAWIGYSSIGLWNKNYSPIFHKSDTSDLCNSKAALSNVLIHEHLEFSVLYVFSVGICNWIAGNQIPLVSLTVSTGLSSFYRFFFFFFLLLMWIIFPLAFIEVIGVLFSSSTSRETVLVIENWSICFRAIFQW